MSAEHPGRTESPGGTTTPESEKWNFRVLLGQGVCFETAEVLASPRLVIPFLYFAVGAPIFFAGLLVPLVQFARLVTEIVAAPVLTAARTRKWFIMLAALATATALTIVALAMRAESTFFVVAIFLLVALVLGTFRGLNTLAYNDLIGRSLRHQGRNRLMFTQTMIAGVVTILLTWAAHHFTAASTPLDRHLDLLWGGIAVTVLAALFAMTVREPLADGDGGYQESAQRNRQTNGQGYLATLRDGLSEVARVPWFRSYVVARCLLVSVELAMPFYAIHAAALHSHKQVSLSIFVVATGIAVVIGGPFWQILGRISERYVMALGAGITACAGVWALTIEATPALQHPVPHGLVVALVALGTQGVIGARVLHLVNATSEDKRPYYVAISNTSAGVVGILFAFVFSSLAHLQGAAWPLFAIVGLNVLAAWSCIRLTEPART